MSIPHAIRLFVLVPGLVAASGVVWASRCDGVNAHGQTGGAYFSKSVPYQEDVFSFCSIGIPAHCWVPTGPGTWKQICQYLNTRWIPKFEEVCRHGKNMGAWGPSSRMPLNTKGHPGSPDGMTDCTHGDDF